MKKLKFNILKKILGFKTSEQSFAFLILILITFILIEPIVKDLGFLANIITSIVISFVPFAIIRAAGKNKKERRRAFMIGIIFLILVWLNVLVEAHFMRILFSLYLIVFYVYPLRIIVRHLLTSRKITLNTIYAAIAGYLLIGLAWASIYTAINILKPGSFLNIEGVNDSIYYSFLTLTTLGYGDIVPLTALAKRVAVLESMVGVLYNAIVIAFIVGIYISERLAKKESE
ncbi:MAG: hypothetical protein K9L84_04110 [Candidatus Omnitrophica bacterium]|nr:hypothetical protein [Candidatus Omnitrophota bacterium]MCF7894225.1 hypothetical protein [Candidatus Omnitrophota bacterium]